MSQPTEAAHTGPQLFKWACLLVATAALAVLLWMLNDVRLEVKAIAPKVEKLADKSEQLVEKADRTVTHTEKIAVTVDAKLPTLLERSESLLTRSDEAVGHLDRLTEGMERYQHLMGVVHAGSQNKGMLDYGNSILDFLGGQQGRVGVKAPAKEGKEKEALKHPVSVKQWAGHARKDVNFLSILSKTKGEMLHGLARTRSAAPLYLQLGEEAAPQLLGAWLSQNHPESKGVE
jgi:hypothetical protein